MLDNVAEYHSGEMSDSLFVENHFTSKLNFEVKFKDRGLTQMEELDLFQVADDKIINEQFFYNMK